MKINKGSNPSYIFVETFLLHQKDKWLKAEPEQEK